MTKSIMIQGCGSNVGKSLLVAGLCRLAHRRGLIVRPFKPQKYVKQRCCDGRWG